MFRLVLETEIEKIITSESKRARHVKEKRKDSEKVRQLFSRVLCREYLHIGIAQGDHGVM